MSKQQIGVVGMAVMGRNLALNIPIFNTHRMVAEYVEQYGLRLDPETSADIARFRQLYRSEQSVP